VKRGKTKSIRARRGRRTVRSSTKEAPRVAITIRRGGSLAVSPYRVKASHGERVTWEIVDRYGEGRRVRVGNFRPADLRHEPNPPRARPFVSSPPAVRLTPWRTARISGKVHAAHHKGRYSETYDYNLYVSNITPRDLQLHLLGSDPAALRAGSGRRNTKLHR
jgi:hypothetical protein